MTPHLVPVAASDPFLFLSGQLPFNENREIISGEITGQTRQVIANIATVLATMNYTLDDVVKTTVWLRNAADFMEFDAAYAESFGAHRPARSTVVSDLVVSSALIEIEAVARRRSAENTKA